VSAIAYFKFLIKSTNQHGVHSPFVYSLVTQCFYRRKKYAPYGNWSKKERLLYRIIQYFQPQTFLEVSERSVVSVFDLDLSIHKEVKLPNYDFVYFDRPSLEDFERLLPTRRNDSIWVINHIYKTQEDQQIWQAFKENPQVKVTVDTYHYGLVFFRKEQEKEHFKIRVL
jgi:hypothetical protein